MLLSSRGSVLQYSFMAFVSQTSVSTTISQKSNLPDSSSTSSTSFSCCTLLLLLLVVGAGLDLFDPPVLSALATAGIVFLQKQQSRKSSSSPESFDFLFPLSPYCCYYLLTALLSSILSLSTLHSFPLSFHAKNRVKKNGRRKRVSASRTLPWGVLHRPTLSADWQREMNKYAFYC